MSNSKTQYPKEIVTFEKVTEDSKDEIKVITVVSNTYEEEAVNAAITYQATFNEQDASGCDKLLNFPHARLGLMNNKLVVTEKPPQMPQSFFKWFVNDYGWKHSCWDYRRVVQSCESRVHLAIQFSRYRSDGSKIGTFPSFWVITNQEGHWGIKMRSSFA
ncbi:MAG: hypothetical protein ACTSWY_06610 [Promethearchaeota archaeon]